MKKKLLSLLILLCFASITVVDAGRKVTGYTETPNYFKGDHNFHAGSSTKITMEGGYSAYCIDPGRVTATNNATCNESTVDGAHGAGYATIMSSDADEDTKGLAMRIYATATGTNNFQKNSSSESVINTKCGYVRAAKLAADKAGTQIDSKLNDAKSYGGTNCANDFSLYTEGEDNKVTSDAINLASEALKTSNSAEGGAVGYNAPSCSAKSSKGKVTISCSNVPEGSEISVSGPLTLENSSFNSGVLTNEYKVDCSGGNNKFSADLIYNAEAGQCSEVVSYSCPDLGYDVQNYIGCNQESDGSGQTKLPIATNQQASCGDPTDPEDDCTEIPGYIDNTSGGIPGVGDALCNSFGEVVVAVTEGDEYNSTIESIDACIIGEEDITGAPLESTELVLGESVLTNEYCNIYCTEDYEFLSPGPLSAQDKNGNEFLITSGSYFTFDPSEAKDKTTIYCYGENYIDKLMENIINGKAGKVGAQDYADILAETTTECKTEVDEETGEEIIYEKTTSKTYTARRKGSNLEVEIVMNIPQTSGWLEVTSCSPMTEKADAGTIETAKNNYISYANEQVALFDDCNGWSLENEKFKTAVGVGGTCHPNVYFTYTDGEWLNLTEKELVLEEVKVDTLDTTNSYKSTTGKYDDTTKAKTNATIDLGIGKETDQFTDANYTSGSATITNTYKLNSVGICNNYNTGESSYTLTKDQCEAIPGATYTEGWPVSYETTQGEYAYQFIISNYGHYLSGGNCQAGRLEAVAFELGVDTIDLECPYKVNGCDDCPWGCDPEGICGGDPECDDECIWECRKVGCIFDIQNGLAVDFEPISLKNPFLAANIKYLNDMHNNAIAYNINNKQTEQEEKNNDANAVVAVGTPNKSGLAANWRTEKGSAALAEIEGLGEEAYTDDHLEYRITLSPRDINIIRNYNSSNEVQNNGGYLNSTLNCVNNGED